MYGDFNGSLLVTVEENGTLVWKSNGQRTDDWQTVVVHLSELHHGFVKKYKILIAAKEKIMSAYNK